VPGNKRLALMQPYIFPYIGYFQLINAVDKFVIYDDVTFIKQGWINRNSILLNGERHLFTVPLINVSSNIRICDTLIYDQKTWRAKFLKTIDQAYKKAPHFPSVYELVSEIVTTSSANMAALAFRSVKLILEYIGINTELKESSIDYGNRNLSAQERVIDICKREGANTYINSIGGMEIYSKNKFRDHGIDLHFIKTLDVTYRQYNGHFTPQLSIIDVLMFNNREEIAALLGQYELI
jgi:hypothetical protein